LLRIARELLVIAERLDLTPGKKITPQDIEAAGQRWARYQRRRGRTHTAKWSRELFVQVAIGWLRFLGRVKEPCRQPGAFASQVEDFVAHLRDQRGLSPNTIQGRRWHVERFFESVTVSEGSLADLTIEDVDNFCPDCSRRELFLTMRPPFRPLSSSCMYHVTSRRISALGIQTRHQGPHCLRHACANHLVAERFSLKEIGDHLGHRSSLTTSIYAKVDLSGLREVADFDLGGLL